MTARQNAHLHMYAGLIATCNAHAPVWTGFPPFADTYTEFMGLYESITPRIADQSTTSVGATRDKANLRTAFGTELLRLNTVLTMYSRIHNQPELAEDVKMTPSMTQKLNEDELVGRGGKIIDVAGSIDPALLIPLGFTPAMLEAARNSMQSFMRALYAPANARANSARATRELAETIDAIQKLLRERLDLAATLLMDSHPDFYNIYKLARVIVDPGFRTRALTVKVKDKSTGKFLSGVSAVIMPGEITKKTGEGGGFYVKSLAEGAYTLSLMLEGYGQEVVTFRTVAKQPKVLEVVMEPMPQEVVES